MAKKDLVQLRVTRPGNHHIAEGLVRGPKGARKGDAFWAPRSRATNKEKNGYVDIGFAEPIGAGVAPGEASQPGPAEASLGGPDEKKSSSAAPAGPSIASPKSGEGGTVRQSFLSEADRASIGRRSGSSNAGGTEEPGGA